MLRRVIKLNLKSNFNEYNFKFSIIIPVYNSENYLVESINSIINQTLNFENNVEIILIDDGSVDNSTEICLSYQKQYPKNIQFFSTSHKGIANARNVGLEHASGKYINFLDSDDLLSQNTLNEVYKFFEKNFNETDVVSIPMYYFERTDDSHELNYKYESSRVINLNQDPNNPQISISSTFIKKDAITEKFNTELICSEDTLLLNKILLQKRTMGVLKNTSYYYRKREDYGSFTDKIQFKKEFHTPRMKNFHLELLNFCKNTYGEIPSFIQYLIIYDLKTVVKQKKLFMCDNKNEEDELFYYLRHIMGYIGKYGILNNRNIGFPLNCLFYYFRKNDIHYEQKNNDVFLKIGDHTADKLNNHYIQFENVEIKNDILKIKGLFRTLFNKRVISIEAIKKSKNGLKDYISPVHLSDYSGNELIYLSKKIPYEYNLDFSIPIDKNTESISFRVNFHKNKNNLDFSENNLVSSCKYFLEIENNEINIINKLFNFSIVIAVYNTAKYLPKAIESIIYQTIGFEDHVQLILVNDGSEDESEEILLNYQKQYPNNIFVISQDNSGQASARNNGLNYVQGKYVNFMDSDDYLSKNALKEVFKFFEEHESEIDLVSIPMTFFGRKTSPHMLNPKFTKTRVVNLIKDPNNPQLSSSSAFIKRDCLKKYKFPTNVSFSEDSILVNKLLLEKKKYGMVKTATYYYRKREDTGSTMDNVDTKKEYFTDKLKYYYMELINYALAKEGGVPDFLQYTLAYDLQWMIKQPTLEVLETVEEKAEFWFYLMLVTSYIGDSAIIHNKFVTKNDFKPFFLNFKTKGLHFDYFNHDVAYKTNTYQIDRLQRHNIWMDIVSIKDGILTLAGLLHSHFDIDHVSFEAIKDKNGETESFIGKYVKYTPREDTVYLDIPWTFKNNFEIKIPINPGEEFKLKIKTNYHKDGDKSNFDDDNLISMYNDIKFSNHARMSDISNYLIKDDTVVVFKNDTFYICPYTFKSMIKRELNVLKTLRKSKNKFSNNAIKLRLIYLLCYPFFRYLKRKHEFYLFMDRESVADDNAMHLFKYAQNIKDNVNKYFILEKGNDYSKMSKIGKVIEYNSFKYKLYYLFADKIITTHPYDTVLNPFFVYGQDERPFYAGLITHQLYFLQHGVTKDNISSWLTKYDKNLSLIVTVSDKERESFFDDGYAFDEDVVQVLGFPRYDNLKNEDIKKEILIIPTWRKYLRGNKSAFLNSEYFKSLNNLLSNEEFINLAEKRGYQIVFKPHPELNKYIGDTGERYRDLLDINEKIKLSTEETYQELLNSASLLITDYSSVFFDFAYLKKPLIYYRSGDDYHYEENYFDYETMGFGDVIDNSEDLLNKIKFYLESDCKMEDKFQKRVDDFFKFNDRNNCKRVYDWIKEH